MCVFLLAWSRVLLSQVYFSYTLDVFFISNVHNTIQRHLAVTSLLVFCVLSPLLSAGVYVRLRNELLNFLTAWCIVGLGSLTAMSTNISVLQYVNVVCVSEQLAYSVFTVLLFKKCARAPNRRTAVCPRTH